MWTVGMYDSNSLFLLNPSRTDVYCTVYVIKPHQVISLMKNGHLCMHRSCRGQATRYLCQYGDGGFGGSAVLLQPPHFQ